MDEWGKLNRSKLMVGMAYHYALILTGLKSEGIMINVPALSFSRSVLRRCANEEIIQTCSHRCHDNWCGTPYLLPAGVGQQIR
jgi:hypothetical protein